MEVGGGFLINAHLAFIHSHLLRYVHTQNSRDNMSVVLVTFPGAPKVSKEAIEAVSHKFAHMYIYTDFATSQYLIITQNISSHDTTVTMCIVSIFPIYYTVVGYQLHWFRQCSV